jgi:hypothetical protein
MNRDERIALLKDRLEEVADRPQRLWAKNAYRVFTVYRAPTELLILNPTNRRFTAERMEFEAALGHALDPIAREEDEKSIISLLLDRDHQIEGARIVGKQSKATDALSVDWDKRQQEQPLWIRSDGLVSNGNRRLALLKRLADQRGRDGYDWVDVIVLDDPPYDDDDVFEMEAREQLTEGLKMRYSDLNQLLTLRDAADREQISWHEDASVLEIAGRLQHLVRRNNVAYAKIQLDAIRYMQDYLEHIGEAENFPRLRRSVERFRDVGKNMAWVRREDPEREADMLEACYGAISSGKRYGAVRGLRIMLATNPDKFDELLKEMRQVEDEAPPDEDAPDDEAIAEEEEEFGDEEDEVPDEDPSPAPHYPRRSVSRVLDLALDEQNNPHRDDGEFQVRSAASRLADVDPECLPGLLEAATGEHLHGAVESILAWAEAARSALED